VIFREVPEGAILFSIETESYFSLNAIGVAVWRLLPPECVHEDEVVARLSTDYPEVRAETIAADVRSLVEDLVDHGLVEAWQSATTN
jgi:hypothetical protein